MKISQLRLARCGNRSQVVGGPDPTNWLLPSLPEGWSICSFHYFVDWATNPLAVAGPVLLTRLVEFDYAESPGTVDAERVLDAFRRSGFGTQFEELRAVCANYGKEAKVVLLPECDEKQITTETPIWTIVHGEPEGLTIRTHPLAKLKTSIKRHSGGPVPVGSKGLILGTSAIECFLSRTDAAYPGDADAVVVDAHGLVRHVIEYKKHTVSGPINEHLAQRYYPAPDGRKYRRLDALVSEFNRADHTDANLSILYYSTSQRQVRLQVVGNLGACRIEITSDTGDLDVDGMSDLEISEMVSAGLGVAA